VTATIEQMGIGGSIHTKLYTVHKMKFYHYKKQIIS